MVSEEEYKQAKIDFVSNLSGSGKADLLIVFAVAAACSLFHRSVAPFLPKNTFVRYIIELGYMVGAPLLVITYSDLSIPLYVAMVVISLICYRYMMLMTCLAILAVDFTVFPRKFAKTETYGISVMDMGVGCVVLAGALVSRQARAATDTTSQKAKQNKNNNKTNNNENKGRIYYAWGALKSCLPLLILGLARIILTKSANYHEHVSEYGIHWNFFFTLSFVALFTALVNVPTKHSAIVGLLIAAGYQVVLSNFGLKEYILNHPRENFISANKEGLCSIFGYMSIYLVGTQLGYILFTPRKDRREWIKDTLKLIIWTIIAFASAYFSETYIDPVSRRMANLPYVLYTIAYTLYTMTGCLVVSLFFPNSPSLILSAINRNQLFFFLLGNISTGLVNISMQTLYASPFTAMSVLFTYIFLLCGIAVILDKRNIVLRI